MDFFVDRRMSKIKIIPLGATEQQSQGICVPELLKHISNTNFISWKEIRDKAEMSRNAVETN